MSLLLFGTVLLLLGLVAAQENCTNDDIRLLAYNGNNYLEYCYQRDWRQIKESVCENQNFYRRCRYGVWTDTEARVACKQLGYSGEGAQSGFSKLNSSLVSSRFFQITGGCRGTESRLQDCPDLDFSSNYCLNNRFRNFATLQCQTACSTEGYTRLVNGSTVMEGRVEVCVNGLWGTVCNNNPELAGAVCSQMRFSTEGANVVSTFGSSFSPINNCTLKDGGSLTCAPVTESNTTCMELRITCQHKAQCSNTSTKFVNSAVLLNISTYNELTERPSVLTTTILGIFIGLFIALLIGMIIALVVTSSRKRSTRKVISTVYTKKPGTSQNITPRLQNGDHRESGRVSMVTDLTDNSAYGQVEQEENAYEIEEDLTDNSAYGQVEQEENAYEIVTICN
ncbi:lysyl oxidase homolog 2-like [Halichondria panicea]|uniref:lysyl oxidase homolog 2-like n=1 Tax=Halichondria panicea TaxID=6063 RepID=UPI00312B6BAD